MKITRKHITALLVTALTTLLVSYLCRIPISYGEIKKSDDGKYIASVTAHRIGALGLFNSLDKVIFRLANTDEKIALTKEFSAGELDDPTKIGDRSKVLVQWNGESVKISDPWKRSVVWNVQDI